MKHLKWNESEILDAFGQIMESKGMLKTAQMAPLSDDEKVNLQHFLAGLQTMPSNGPGMEKWMQRLKGQEDPYLKSVYDALAKRHDLWQLGKGTEEIAAVPLPSVTPVAKEPAPQPSAPMAARSAAETGNKKTADQKLYEVTPKENMVQEAHPGAAKVEGDVVENLEQQQKADLEVAHKSAQTKEILAALYKLAKKLQTEGNDKAYSMVKEAFLDISKTLKA